MIDGAGEATDVQRRRVVWTRALSKPGTGKRPRLIPLLAPTLIWTHRCLLVRPVVFRVSDRVGPRWVSRPSQSEEGQHFTHTAHVAVEPGSTPLAVIRVPSIQRF